jgi:hypothetical protein
MSQIRNLLHFVILDKIWVRGRFPHYEYIVNYTYAFGYKGWGGYRIKQKDILINNQYGHILFGSDWWRAKETYELSTGGAAAA